ncbi:MAG: zinc ribbon domain-containing protein [Ruminococcus sp.]|nr:zinc ribbon domain-containing protein [Ruminococcus sp.]
MLLASNFFEDLAMMLIGGCCAAAWLSSFIFTRLLGIGECPVISGIIGAAIGTGTLFILPTDVMWLSMVIAAVVTLAAAIVIDRLFYVQTKDLPKAGSIPQQTSALPAPEDNADWKCSSCGNTNTSDAKFCRSCGAKKPQVKTSVLPSPAALQAQNGWVCKKCGNENTPDAKFCRKCGEKNVSAQPVQVAVPKEKTPGGNGSVLFIAAIITAVIGIIVNLAGMPDLFKRRQDLEASMRLHRKDISWFEMDKLEYDFIGYTFVLVGAAVLAYVLMILLRKRFLSLVCCVPSTVLLIVFTSQANYKSHYSDYVLAAMAGLSVLAILYSFKDHIVIWILQLAASGAAAYFIYVWCHNCKLTEEMLPWCGNPVGCTILVLLLNIAVKRSKAFTAAHTQEKVENTESV